MKKWERDMMHIKGKTLIIIMLSFSSLCLAQKVTEMPLVLQMPGMDKVEVKSMTYKTIKETHLRMDVYYPPDFDKQSKLPVVIFNNGVGILNLPEWRGYQDWAKLVAVSNLIAINYQSRSEDAMEDSEDLIEFVRTHGDELKVDIERMALWSSSSNVNIGMQLIMQKNRSYIRCAAIFYGMKDVPEIRQDIALFIARAGLDLLSLNKNIDTFLSKALNADIDLEFVNYLEGYHAFDIFNDTDRSREIIKQTLNFLVFHLKKTYGEESRIVPTARILYSTIAKGNYGLFKRLFNYAFEKYKYEKLEVLNRAASEGSLSEIGNQLLQDGKNREALVVFGFYVDTYPDSPNAYNCLAGAYEAEGMGELAIKNAKKAIELLEKAVNLSEMQKNRIRESAMQKIKHSKN
jgi:hypothetical protein